MRLQTSFHAAFAAIVLVIGALVMTACGGAASPTPAPTAVPTTLAATTAPTSVPATATTAPTSAPTTAPATATTAAASAPTASAATTGANSGSAGATDPVAALAKFQKAKSYNLNAKADVSKIFFQGPSGPADASNPNQVLLFDVQGTTQTPDEDYTVGGFFGSLLGVFSGFDEKNPKLGVIVVNGKSYLNGILSGQTAAKWYTLPADGSQTLQFQPEQFMSPFAKAAAGDFTKAGSEMLDGHACDVYTLSPSGFDAAFDVISQNSGLEPTKIDASSIDTRDSKFWVCDDGQIHQIQFNLTAHDKTDATQKGTFTYAVQISDYDAPQTIQAPTGATPLPSGGALGQPTAEATTAAGGVSGPDGDWEGTTSSGDDISFTVENGAITYATLSYEGTDTVACDDTTVHESGIPVKGGAIKDNHFSLELDGSQETGTAHYTFTGDLDGSAAKGTLHVAEELPCGKGASDVTWTATNTSVSAGDETPTPEDAGAATDTPSTEDTPSADETPTAGTGDVTNAQDAAQAFFDAVNSKNYDAALALVGDQVVFNLGTAQGVGKDGLKSALSSANLTYELSNFQATDEEVSFTAKRSDGKTLTGAVVLQDGKIAVIGLQ